MTAKTINRKARRAQSRAFLQEFSGPTLPHADTSGRAVVWESARLNREMYEVYFDEIMTLALNRFRWEGLPATVDPLFLERILLFEGMASIAFPKEKKGLFLATSVAEDAPLNLYMRPTKWKAVPNTSQKQSFPASFATGTVIYENQTRFPLLQKVEAYAQQLADIYITRRVNLYHQRIPMVLTAPQDKELDAVNTAKQVGGGEPIILGVDEFNKEVDYRALTTSPAPFIGKELVEAERAVWARIFDTFGIPNVIFKAERQITTEVETQNEETSVIRLGGLRERRLAADQLNRRFYYPNPFFPQLLKKPIKVYKAEDYESTNWNILHSLAGKEKEPQQ